MHMKSTEPFPGSAYFGGASISMDAMLLPLMDRANARRGQNAGGAAGN